MYFYALGLFIYIAMIFLECAVESFDGTPLTPQFIRKTFIWPLRIGLFFTMAIINVSNDCMAGFLLAFGFHYKRTELYIQIDEMTLKLIS
jgi:hypothetical protein